MIEAELAWLEAVMTERFASFSDGTGIYPEKLSCPPPVAHRLGPYAALVRKHHLSHEERLTLALALAPHVAPALLDPFLLQNQATGRRFSEFGGITGSVHGGFLPTAETALFLLAGDDRARHITVEALFARDRPLVGQGIVILDHRHPDEPPMSATLRLSSSALHEFLRGPDHVPEPGPDFPARRIVTSLGWDDLVLDESTLSQVDMIARWVQHEGTLMRDWDLARRLKPGYRCLFYGPPGTGKTLTASLLGQRFSMPVYRVDLSLVVSKWIGETEKNLATLFDQAQGRNWILFFDEADALFGKRTDAQSSNDRSANQQIAYLLQRLEDFPGLAILATNQRDHFDEAFARRFQSAIRFPIPDAPARQRLWRESFAGLGVALSPEIDFAAIAEKYELSGGAIINVLRYACLMAVERTPPVVLSHDLLDGIRRELQKDGRFVSK